MSLVDVSESARVSGLLTRGRTSLAAAGGAFANRNIRLLLGAFVGTSLGGWMGSIAVSVYAFRAGGTTALGIYMALRLIPGAMVSPFAGTLADRYPKTRLMIVADLASAVTVLLTAGLIAADAPTWAVFATAITRSVVSSPFAPARAALIPSLARSPQELTSSNVASSSVEGLAVFVGPAIGGGLLAATSYQTTLLVVAATYLWSAVLVSRIKAPRSQPEDAEAALEPAGVTSESAASSGFLSETADGVRAVTHDPVLRVVVGLFVLQFLVNGLINVLSVAIALDLLDLGDGAVGTLMGAVGLGGVLGLVVTVALAGARRLAPVFATGLVLWGLPLTLIPLWPHQWFVLVMLGLVGIGTALTEVAGITLLQRSAPEAMLGRVFGMLETGILLMLGLGGLAAPLLVSAFGLDAALIISGAWLPLVVILTYRQLARIDATTAATVDQADLRLLLGVPMFAPLKPYTVEQLAGELQHRTAAAHTSIVDQGDPGTEFFVIASGTVEIVVDGKQIRTQGPGDWFGEIALLRESPRTATVRAVSDIDLLVLAGDRFTAAVSGHARSTQAAEAIAAARLATACPGRVGTTV